MNARKPLIAVSILLLLSSGVVQADEGKGQLGRVKFTNSCDPKEQPLPESGVALLHSE